jgi:hypothetical protein
MSVSTTLIMSTRLIDPAERANHDFRHNSMTFGKCSRREQCRRALRALVWPRLHRALAPRMSDASVSLCSSSELTGARAFQNNA